MERVEPPNVLRNNVPGRGNNKRKDPEARVCQAWSKNSKGVVWLKCSERDSGRRWGGTRELDQGGLLGTCKALGFAPPRKSLVGSESWRA